MRIRILFLFCFLTALLKAQNLPNKFYNDEVVEIAFKLNDNELLELVENGISQKFLVEFNPRTALVGKFDKDSTKLKLKEGNYLIVKSNYKKFGFSVITNEKYLIFSFKLNNKIHYWAQDQNNKQILDWSLTFKGRTLKSDGMGLIISNPNHNVNYGIAKVNGESILVYLDIYQKKAISSSAYRGSSPPIIDKGAILLNKPVYKPGDTIKFKAYLYNKRGRPQRGKTRFIVYANQSIYGEIYGKPNKNGGFEGQFIINDSFPINRTYNIRAIRGNNIKGSLDFQIKNYELNLYKPDWCIVPKLLLYKEDLVLNPVLLDANNNLVFDGSIRVKIRTSRPKGFLESKLIFDQRFLNHYLDTTIGLDQLVGSPIKIKNELLPSFNCDLIISLEIKTSDGKIFNLNDQIINRSFQLFDIGANDQEIFAYSINNKNLDTVLSAEITYQDFTKGTKKLQLPIKIDSLNGVDEISITFNGIDGVLKEFKWESEFNDPLNCFTKNDSLFIKLIRRPYEQGILFIYDKNKLLNQYYSPNLDTVLYLGINNNYTLLYYSLNEGEFFKKSFSRNKKEIRLSHNLEEIIYPGKEVSVLLNLRDGHNLPMKNYEFSAFAWNNQMAEIDNHSFQIKNAVNYSPSNILVSNSSFHNTGEFYLDYNRNNISKYLLLDSLDERRSMLNNKNGYDLRYFESRGNFIVFNNLNESSPIMIWANDMPILNNLSSVKQNLVIPIKKGIYTIKILEGYEIFEIKGVEVKENNTVVFTYDSDNFRYGINNYDKNNISKLKLSDADRAKILNSLSQHILKIKFASEFNNHEIEVFNEDRSQIYCFKNNVNYMQFFFYKTSKIYLKVNNREYELNNNDKNYIDIISFEPFNVQYFLSEVDESSILKYLRIIPVFSTPEVPKSNEKAIKNPWDSIYQSIISFISNSSYVWNTTEHQKLFIDKKNKDIQHTFIIDLLNPYWSLYLNPTNKEILTQAGGKYKLVQLTHDGEISELDLEIEKGKEYFINNEFLEWKKISPSYLNQLYYYFLTADSVPPLFTDIEIQNGYQKQILFDKNSYNKIIIKTENYKNKPAYVQLVVDRKIIHQAPTFNRNWVEFRIQENTNYQLQIVNLRQREIYKEPININKGENLIIKIFHSEINWNKTDDPILEKQKVNPDLQRGPISISGVVKDKDTKEPIGFAGVVILKDGVQIGGTVSDLEGNFTFRNLEPGKYDLNIQFVGYSDFKLIGVKVKPNEITRINAYLTSGVELEAVMIVYKEPKFKESSNGLDFIAFRGNSFTPNTAGVLSSDKETQSFRGGRANGTAYYIDGERVTGGITLQQSGIYAMDEPMFDINESSGTGLSAEQENNRMENLIGKTQIRKTFNDVAYWFPSLRTDQSGQVAFTVKFPDNITSWNNYFMGTNKNDYILNYVFKTKSYLPVSSQLILPKLLIEGDSLLVKTRTLNYTGNQHPARLYFKGFGLTDSLNINLDRLDTTNFWIYNAQNISDSVELKINISNGFEDGEKKLLKSQEQGIRYFSDSVVLLKENEKFKQKFFELGDQKNYEIVIYNNWVQIIERNIQLLNNYQYGCVEQTASKLRALLYEEELRKYLNQEFDKSNEIRALIRKLNKFRNKQDLWGWWSDGASNFNMSIYVLEVFSEAKKQGYSVGNLEESFEKLKGFFPTNSPSTMLEILEMEHVLGIKTDTFKLNYIKGDFSNLNTMDLIRLAKIRHLYNIEFDDKIIFDKLKYDQYQLPYLTEGLGDIFLESNQMSINAIEYLNLKRSRPGLADSMKMHLILKGEEALNTLDRAQLLSVLVKNLNSNNRSLSNLLINGNLQLPQNIYKIKNGDEVEITGQNSFYGHSIFIIRHQNIVKDQALEAKGIQLNPLDSLERDLFLFEELNLGTQILLQEKKEYLMLEIPIPAGIWVDFNKINGPYITHKEQYEDRIIIYYSKLNKGTFQVNIPARVIFKGNFTRNPSLISSMYDSEFKASNRMSKIRVR